MVSFKKDKEKESTGLVSPPLTPAPSSLQPPVTPNAGSTRSRSGSRNGSSAAGGSSALPPPAYTAVDAGPSVAPGAAAAMGPPLPEDDEAAQAMLTAAFASLKLSASPRDPDADTCLAHLKVLSAFQTLKDDVGYTDGLWGIWDARALGPDFASVDDLPPGPGPEMAGKALREPVDSDPRAQVARLREKRWAVFLARAVDRYESWWSVLSSSGGLGFLAEYNMERPGDPKYENFPRYEDAFKWTPDNLPPLDVLMVWHAHMLNPRAYLEDCIRYGYRALWYTGIPWQLVNEAIDTKFGYDVSDDCKSNWLLRTGRAWDNADDPLIKVLRCPCCSTPHEVPWTTVGSAQESVKKLE